MNLFDARPHLDRPALLSNALQTMQINVGRKIQQTVNLFM